MKRCTACGETKPLDAFHVSKQTRDGFYPYCRACHNAKGRARYKRNLEAARLASSERTQRWRAADPERARATSARHTRAFREANPAYALNWYHQHAETERPRAREQMRRWRAANPEAARDIKRRYREANIDEVRKRERENTQRRRALKGPTSRALAELMAVLVTQPCTYCGVAENITIDHIVPLSRGGEHEAANLTAACCSCNSSKGAKLLDEWNHGEPVVP